MKKEVCFIVLNYNDSDTTIKLVNGLKTWESLENNYHIIIVDNRSKDNSYENLKIQFDGNDKIDILLSEKNGGYSYGNNVGARYAIDKYCPDYIAIANPDIVIEKDCFEELLKTFKESEKIAMVAPVMKDIHGNFSIYAQMLPTYQDDLIACYCSSKSKTIRRTNFEILNKNPNMIFTQMLPGSFFTIRTDVFEKIGMFDENVFLFCEERILGKRLSDNGYKAILRNDLFFTHIHSTSVKKVYDIKETWKLIMRSRLYYEKEYNEISFIKFVVLKMSMDIFIVCLSVKLNAYRILKRKRVRKDS